LTRIYSKKTDNCIIDIEENYQKYKLFVDGDYLVIEAILLIG